MNQNPQALPAGWRLEVHGPACGWPNCTIIITSPQGVQVRFVHGPDQTANALTLQLQKALGYRVGDQST